MGREEPRGVIFPKTAWVHQAIGVVLSLVLIVFTLVRSPTGFFWAVVPIICALYLAVTVVLCIRPPGVYLLPDAIVVRRFGHKLCIDRKEFCESLFTHSERVIGGQSPTSSRHLSFVISQNGTEKTINAMWCDALLGRLSATEVALAGTELDTWRKRGAASQR